METNLSFTPYELKMKEYAKENNVPIILDEGLSFLEMIIKIKQPKKVLEIGTAIGYSATRITRVCNSEVYTIERDLKMYNEALNNIKNQGLEDKVHLIFKDALESFDLVKDNQFDLIFIDAAKSQYIKFFETYTPLLSESGVVVSDNMEFHGLIDNPKDDISRNLKAMLRKLRGYHTYLLENKDFDSVIYNQVGDGMAVSIKK